MSVGSPAEALARLRRARRVLITAHRNPDGDSLGSSLAAAELVEALGGAATVVSRDPWPTNLRDLPGVERVLVSETLPEDARERFDLAMVLECPGLDRPGLDGLAALPILNIDHHLANEHYGEVDWVDESSPAVGEMVWRLYREAGVQPSPSAATNTYVALSTDTGDFRYDNATPAAFRAAAEMVEAGAEPSRVAAWVHERRSAASVRLLAVALATLRLECGDRLATMVVDPEAFRRAGATPADTDAIVNVPRSVDTVQVVALFKQSDPGVVRVSLRSKGDLDVRRVAAEFAGGGHTNAAGCTVRDSLENARAAVTGRLRRLLECP